jgi:hypothetical protein
MEIAAELGAKAVLSSIWGGEREFYIEKFGEICDLAKPFGLTVDLEYVPIAAVANIAQAVDVLRAVNRSNAGLMVDMHHFHRARDNPADLDALPREWFHFAHLCDAPAEIPTERAEMIRILREARLYVGEGGHRRREHPGAHPALRLLDRAAQQGTARGDRLCRTRDAMPRDAEGVSRQARRGEGRPRQAPFGTSDDWNPARRCSPLIGAHGMKKHIKAVDAHGRKLGGETPLLCTPLVGRTRKRVLAEAASVLRQKPDLVEWRVDFFDAVGDRRRDRDGARAAGHRRQASRHFHPPLGERGWRADRDRRRGGRRALRGRGEDAARRLHRFRIGQRPRSFAPRA